MSGHTKGPWTLETVRTSCGQCHKIGPFTSNRDKDNYACVYADGIQDYDIGHNAVGDELLANARLIAAAPDMLEALESAMVTLPLAPCFCAESFVCSRCLAMEQACVSIAKAKGGAT